MTKLFGNTIKRIFGWRRLRTVFITAAIIFILFANGWKISYWILIGRLVFIGLCALTVFGIFERWPQRLPNWLARWALQVAGVAVAMPIAVWIAYTVTNLELTEAWWRDKDRLVGFGTFTFLSMLIGPWIAATALFKQIKNEAQNQALAFALERSNFEKQALNASLKLLQAQVEPHFLFNTLANVRELVISGSPQAATVLDSLIAYLRAAVPRINAPMATIAQELDLVRAYLEIMQVRMPDRLRFSIQAKGDTTAFTCPPLSLLTLVENAVRHGIDPSEVGGQIDISVLLHEGIWHAEVLDTGIGYNATTTNNFTAITQTTGTGLANLRERLRLTFGDQATLTLSAIQPHGMRAQIRFPALHDSPKTL